MAEGRETTTSSITGSMNAFELPEKYEFVRILGQGGFGQVLRCVKKDTKEVVAVKIPKHRTTTDIREVGHFIDFNVHSCKRVCIVRATLSIQ